MIQQNITPNLWFDHQAEEAAEFYVSVFGEGSEITNKLRFMNEGREIHGKEAGSVMTVDFTLRGQKFTALNGGPHFTFNEAVSFIVNCKSQEEVDYFWEKLTEGGDSKAQQCGWLKDKYGVSWQIIPTVLMELLQDPDQEKAQRVMREMLKMKKIDIESLKNA